jgi:GT2 family glycosyltransferase
VRVAVLTLTRDRLEYTKHCFATLSELAGCDYDHYVLDQGSQDGTPGWLIQEFETADRFAGLAIMPDNIGCTRGWNTLLRELCDPSDYDVIVTFDNDCEVVTPDTLKVVATLAAESGNILAPRVDGLMYPPGAIGHFALMYEGELFDVEETTVLGNICMAIPAPLLARDGFRWDERYAVWDGGESITMWHRERGGWCGYVPAFRVNHYKTTLGQREDMPWYAERRVLEGGRAA